MAKSLLYSDADCGDAIQNTIVKAFSNLDSLKEDRYAKTWMVRILKNECFMIMRKEKNEVSYDSIVQEERYIHKDYSEGEADYYDIRGGERSNNYITDFRPDETVTVHFAKVVNEGELDKMYLSMDGYAYNFTEQALAIGYVDIRQE